MHTLRVSVALVALALVGGCKQGVGIAGNNNENVNDNENINENNNVGPDGSTGPVCGDDVIEAPEQCEGVDLAGENCQSLGFGGGDLACTAQCTFDLSSCVGGCGNGITETGEQCDGADLGAWNCWTVAQHSEGTLACASDCTFDESDCHTCGDSSIDGPEECDSAELGGETCVTQGFAQGALACDGQCAFDTSGCEGPPTCGNGVLDAGEECDGALLNGESCGTLGYGQGTLACTALCTFDDTGCQPFVCSVRSPNNPLGRKPLQFFVHPTVDVQLAVELDAVVTNAGPNGPALGEAAVVYDQTAAGHEMAGFLVTRAPVTAALPSEILDILQGIAAMGGVTSTSTRSPGSFVTSHDNHATVVSTLVTVQTGNTLDVGAVRSLIVAELLGRPVGDFTFPPLLGHAGTEFAVSFATQWRGGSLVAITGGVALLWDYEAGGDIAIHVADAGSGSGLALATASTDVSCNIYDMTALPQADIIWVMDETGSMNTKLANISANAGTFFNTAAAYSLDFRIGVTNVEPANNGEFCTALGVSGDTFLGPADLANFQACVQQPWGAGIQAFGLELGVTTGHMAITNHLPRANQADRIRPDAHLAIIYVSDERAQELKDDCGATSGWWVNIDPACMATVIGPTVDLLHGVSDPQGAGRAHAIVGPPTQCAGAFEAGQGYLDIVNATGGQNHSICPTDLGEPMLLILEDIISSASSVVLPHRPISLTLAVAKEDKTTLPSTLVALPRSRTDGFDYRASSNGVVFINQDFSALPYQLVVGYERWLTAEWCSNGADDDGDGDADCADSDCNGQVCGPNGQTCTGGQCTCPGGGTEAACGDGLDNDCDGHVDCADSDCIGVPPCEQPEQSCTDGIDNDADGDTDCDDSDCAGLPAETNCTDGLDNDCDGAVDCADSDCNGVGFCEQPEQTCNDGLDNDGDGLIDGADLMDCGNAIYQMSFDNCFSTWTMTGDWQCGTPSNVGPASCVSGTCVGTILNANHSNNMPWGTNTITSPSILLLFASNPTLTFQSWLDTEGSVWDGVNIKISTNGGANWSLLTTVTPAYNLTIDTQQCWGGHGWNSGWQTFQADLSAYVNQSIMLRFELRADTAVVFPGWYLDNVVILD
ncbi:MAG: hypothetical protein ABI333_24880 [bacterium]